MIRTLMTTTALVALLSSTALAQDATTTMRPGIDFELAQGYAAVDTDDLATRIVGAPVYASAATDADRYGEINDLVLNADGTVRAALIGVGGFLGIGEKNVAVDFSQLTFTIAADNTERWVLETTREALDTAPAFEWIDDEPMDTAVAVDPNAPAGSTTPAEQVAATDPNTPADPNATGTMAPADQVAATNPNDVNVTTETNPNAAASPMSREGMTAIPAGEMTAENIIGTQIIGPEDQVIAEVGDIVLTPEGQVDALLVDFGGFLGMGEKRVAVGIDNLEFVTDESGGRYVWLNVTKEQLDAAPAYDEATYATDPNQRFVTSM